MINIRAHAGRMQYALIQGPPRSGKSALARARADEHLQRNPTHLVVVVDQEARESHFIRRGRTSIVPFDVTSLAYSLRGVDGLIIETRTTSTARHKTDCRYAHKVG